MKLNYSELVEAYSAALHNTLRNFKPVPDFLDTWVPDDEINFSIIGIIEAASESNEREIAVTLSRQELEALDLARLQSETSKIGELRVEANDLVFRFKKGGDLNISSLYQANLAKLANRVVHEGRIDRAEVGQILYKSKNDSAELGILVNNEGRIVGAKHDGAAGTARIILDQFCAEIIGLPIQEASEHGALRLEYRLRDKEANRPVKGILTPNNSEPVFKIPLQMIREIYGKYRAENPDSFKRNFYVDAVQPSFQQLSDADKMARVQEKLREVASEMGLQTTIDVVDWKPDARAVLSFKQDLNLPNVGKNLLKLERRLQEVVDGRLELTLESVDDANKRKERTARKAAPSPTSNITEASPN